MDDLLLALAELLFEFLLEIAGEVVLDLLTRAGAAVFGSEEVAHPIGTWLACVFYGLLAGAVSLAVIPHPVFRRSKMHGISLIVSPVLTGTVMSGIGTLLRRRGKRVVHGEKRGLPDLPHFIPNSKTQGGSGCPPFPMGINPLFRTNQGSK